MSRWKGILIFVTLVLAVWTVLPNFIEFDEGSVFSSKKLVYGLDIQGGLHLVMGVNLEEVVEESTRRYGRNIEEYFKSKNISVTSSFEKEGNRNRLIVKTQQSSQMPQVKQLLKQDFSSYLVIDETDATLTIEQADQFVSQMKKDVVEQAIEVVRNRIDALGLAEPNIAAQGEDRILVQLPGIKDEQVSEAKELINRAARMSFILVSNDKISEQLPAMVVEAEKKGSYDLTTLKYPEYVDKINQDLKSQLPKDTKVLFARNENAENMAQGKIPYLLDTTETLDGNLLRNANVGFGQFNEPEVRLTFNPEGARLFEEITGRNVDRQLAIVLDDVVYSAPNIQGRIAGGSAQITLGRTRNYEEGMKEAKTISMALRAGALPASLEQLEERTVGPTLGADSVEKGKKAILFGGILVLLFMLFTYRSFGLLADFALTTNILLIFAVLSSLEATLTLPGIAGIALTIGMAVDANVIIFERIKEALRKGATLKAAVDEGYNKGFSAIFDANITTAATSIILMYFGTGPVRGFAVTLLIGIITSMFTAIFMTRAIVTWFIVKKDVSKSAILKGM